MCTKDENHGFLKSQKATFCNIFFFKEKNPGDYKTDEEMEGTHSEDEMFAQRGLRRTQSMKSVKTIKGRKEASIILVEFRFSVSISIFHSAEFFF